MAELLLEIFSEEIPARMQVRAAEDLAALLHKELGALMAGKPRAFSGPRRIAVVGEMQRSAVTEGKEERGPRVGAPDQAIEGFLRKHGATRDALVQEGQFWVLHKPGETLEARDLIARAVPAVLRSFPWPKSMRWGTSGFTWVRPLQRILCVFDGAVVPFSLGQGEDAVHGLASGDVTEGHRLLAPGAFAVKDFAEYQQGLRQRSVVLDADERARMIRDGVSQLAAREGLAVVPDEGLVSEVAGLVEWPVPLLASIDGKFMDLPPEVMRTTMRVNQRYFALRHADGSPAPRFALVSNIQASDGGLAIIAGNERVLRARLADARFFWDLDRKEKLESRLPKLDAVVYHAKLGTQGQRVKRLEKLAAIIAPQVGANMQHAVRAAALAKADLASGRVGEFPELQGIRGRYYALHDGEDPRVAEAIAGHYRPMGPGDAVPQEPVSVAVALADKLDQLACFFEVGEKPTGAGDPFALRRAALGLIRIIRENGLRLPLLEVLEEACKEARWAHYRAPLTGEEKGHSEDYARTGIRVSLAGQQVDRTALEVLNFIAERLRVQLRTEGARHDVVAAVFGAAPDDDLVRLLVRAEALKGLVESQDGANLLAAHRRAANILRIEDKKDGPHAGTIDAALLTAPEEITLAEALSHAEPTAAEHLAREEFTAAMAALAALRAPVDAFFDRVTVNDPAPELRRNRLRLLARLRAAMDAVADLSKIEA